MFLPSTKCNGGDRPNVAKSKQRRERRKTARLEQLARIEKEIKDRNDKALGIKT